MVVYHVGNPGRQGGGFARPRTRLADNMAVGVEHNNIILVGIQPNRLVTHVAHMGYITGRLCTCSCVHVYGSFIVGEIIL